MKNLEFLTFSLQDTYWEGDTRRSPEIKDKPALFWAATIYKRTLWLGPKTALKF